MSYLNRCQLIGEIARSPETRTLQSGQSLTKASIKLVKNYTAKDGEAKSSTKYVDLTAWGRASEALSLCVEGQLVLVDGEIDVEAWDDRESGKKRYKVLVNVTSVQPMGTAAPAPESTRAEAARTARKARVAPVDDDSLPF